MVRVLLLVTFVLFCGFNAFAENGDLTVKGDLKVGEPGNQSILDLQGTLSITMHDGSIYIFQYVNSGEDSRGNYSYSSTAVPDTCDGDINITYTCPPDIAKVCVDVKYEPDLDEYDISTVTCRKAIDFVLQ